MQCNIRFGFRHFEKPTAKKNARHENIFFVKIRKSKLFID